jgi:hypothetical protein
VRERLWPRTTEGRWNTLVGAFVFLVALAVYAWCVTPTVPYWDSGEYIATSYILGIPHPPGTPLYVLIGRLFTLLPLGSIAVRVNLLSSLSAAIAVLFTYLITVRLTKKNLAGDGTWWMPLAGGVVAAFFMAFGTTFWDNAIEAEVYASASAIVCLCIWLALLWWDGQGAPRNDHILWLILYVLFLAIGIHLGTFLVFPCIYLLVTMVHWERVRKGLFWGTIVLFLAATVARLAVVSTIDDVDPRIVDLSFASPDVQRTAGVLTLLAALAVIGNLLSVLGLRFTLGIGVLAIIGLSVHGYLLIRAGLNPVINEGDPSTWKSLWLLLSRDQYKPPEAIFRKAEFGYQFSQMYWRYFTWQFHLADLLAGRTYWLPIMVGLFGAFLNFFRNRKSFWLMLTLFVITGPFLVWYLNFKEGEVRERDYFFVVNFHLFAIWIGIGAAALIQWVDELMTPRAALTPPDTSAQARKNTRLDGSIGGLPHPGVLAATGVLVFLSTMPLWAGQGNDNFFRHNRRGNWIAHNYAYNMLVGLEKDAILFTNGDNDTFPLWYLQTVEGFRKDVRVVCLSLLNTDWCIRQLRDEEPKVAVTLTDAQIRQLSPYRDKSGKVVLVKDIMVQHILKANAWRKPVYLAVTVPDQMGLERQLVFEGLVFRVHPEPQAKRMDTARTMENLDTKFRYEGFLDANGDWDTTVYKDEQSTRLLQNYAAARVQLGLSTYEEGKLEQSRIELEKARKMSPHFPGVVAALGYVYERLDRWSDAAAHYEQQLKAFPGDAVLMGNLGRVKAHLGDTAAAVDLLEKSIASEPGTDFAPYTELVNILFTRGEVARCISLLEQWLRYHPDHQQAKSSLELIRNSTTHP